MSCAVKGSRQRVHRLNIYCPGLICFCSLAPSTHAMSKSTTPREWPPPKIYDVRDPPFPAFSPPASDYKQLPPEVSLVIDNGSWHTRAGWSHETSPRMDIPCLYSKWRDRRAQRTYTLVGNDVHVDAMARMNAKSPFDVNLVANFDLLEGVFDYALNKLGVEGGGKVEHPVVLTEPVSVPEHTRKCTLPIFHDLLTTSSFRAHV